MGRKKYSKNRIGANASVDATRIGEILASFYPTLSFAQVKNFSEIKSYRLKVTEKNTVWGHVEIYSELLRHIREKRTGSQSCF